MDRSNIVPIARDAQESTESQRRNFRVLVTVLVTTWAAVLITAVTLTPLPPLVPFAILAVLVVLAEHRFVLFGDETSMSGSMIVIVASVFVFADTAPLAGPVMIASLGGLYFPHLRARAWNRLFFNVSCFGLSAAAAAAVSQAGWDDWLTSRYKIEIAVTATAIYWIANNLIVACHQKYLHDRSFISSTLTLVGSDLGIMFLTATTAYAILFFDLTAPYGCLILTISLVGSAILDQCWQTMSDLLDRLARQWGPLMVWAVVILAALINDSLTPGIVALALVTALLVRRAGTQRDRGQDCVLFSAAAIVAFTSWAFALPIVLVWSVSVRKHQQRWTPWASALLWGVLGTSLSFAALDLSNTLPTVGSTIAATLGPWFVSSLICVGTVATSHRSLNWISTAGLIIPTRGEVLFIALLASASTVLAGSMPTAIGIGTVVVLVRTCSFFKYRETAVTASR